MDLVEDEKAVGCVGDNRFITSQPEGASQQLIRSKDTNRMEMQVS